MIVDLDRAFMPLGDGAAPEPGGLRYSRLYGGAVGWSELLARRRVVVLAEASAGKTTELRRQAESLGGRGFFVRVDILADNSLSEVFDDAANTAFERWRAEGEDDGWFFLDSVDEARISRRSVEMALRRLNRGLAGALPRARIILSCRASDWQVAEDPALILRELPLPPASRTTPSIPNGEEDGDIEAALLARIFNETATEQGALEATTPSPSETVYVAQLLPLDRSQQQLMAEAGKVADVDKFMTAIVRSGLDELAERPGDLLDLIAYWKERGGFGSLADMTEFSVSRRLTERNPDRPDNDRLAPQEARHSAERLAAALTLGRSFTLLAGGDEADASLAAGALDPGKIVVELRDDQRQALIRRGIFAPATYGRLRFHHRSAQDYLTACWLKRLLDGGRPLTPVWDLLFVERYGVKTIAPSLRPAAAWLALWRPEIRDEIIRREPLTLLMQGDPKSLPLSARARLLTAYAEQDKAAALSQAFVDDRALWLFSEPPLADAIRATWALSDRSELRTDLLRCVREGQITACADLALQTALDPSRSDSERIAAVEALVEIDDRAALDQVVEALVRGAIPSLRMASRAAVELFPAFLAVEDLVTLLLRCRPEAGRERDFASLTPALMRRTTAEQRRAFAYAVAAGAGGDAPDEDDDDDGKAPKKIAEMLQGLAGVVTADVLALETGASPGPALISLLGALPPGAVKDAAERNALAEAVKGRPLVNRAMFWRSVMRATEPEFQPRRVFQLSFNGGYWWSLAVSDLEWLAADLAAENDSRRRELLFDAIFITLLQAERLGSDAAWLDEIAAGDSVLVENLARYRRPPEADPDEAKWKASQRAQEKRRDATLARNKRAWLKFRQELMADPNRLADAEAAGDWTKGGHVLSYLAAWLSGEKHDVSAALLRWRDLIPVFGPAVAMAFQAGMRALWRAVEPARPVYSDHNALTTNKMNELAVGALALEASLDPAWILGLTDAEVMRAVRHGAYGEHQSPDWLYALLTERPAVAGPVFVACLEEEWRRKWGRNELLQRCARPSGDAPRVLVDGVLRLTLGPKPANPASFEAAVTCLGQMSLGAEAREALRRLAKRRWKADIKAERLDWARLALALMVTVAPGEAVAALTVWLQVKGRKEKHIHTLFGTLFGRDSNLIAGPAWTAMPTPALEALIGLAYQHLQAPQPSNRTLVASRSEAHGARNRLLEALLQRTGPDAFAALKRLGATRDLGPQARRFDELAHSVAEAASERPAWTEAEVVAFEHDRLAPVKSGADLLDLISDLLQELQHSFTRGDSNAAAALHRLIDEEEVQNFIANQLNLLARDRFKASRETQVANGNKPDITATSHAAAVEVALEIKHGGMPAWTSKKLQSTLTYQLAEQYLLPENRRHGVLVITHHGHKTWKDPVTGRRWSFDELIAWLKDEALRVTANRAGGVEVRVVGLDPGISVEAKPRKKRLRAEIPSAGNERA